jgi:transposase
MQTVWDIGADVDSRFIVVACASQSFAPYRIANERAAILRFLRRFPAGSRIAMESTAGYHELLAHLAHAAQFRVFVINARNLRRYAQGVGQRGKTDRVDAQVIARYVANEHVHLHDYVPLNKAQRELACLLKRRGKLVTMRQTLNQSMRGVPGVSRELKHLKTDLDRLITHLESLIKTTLRQLPEAHRAAEKIETIPGYGELTSAFLGHILTRLPYGSSDAAVAYSGLDPRPNDSGGKTGRRRLSKQGPGQLRQLLYLCAMTAIRTAYWRPYYLAQRAKGLSATAAIVTVARKMLRVAFAVAKHNTDFNPMRGRAQS